MEVLSGHDMVLWFLNPLSSLCCVIVLHVYFYLLPTRNGDREALLHGHARSV